MVDIEKIDDELYKAAYIIKEASNCNEVWEKIKSSSNILREAVQVKKDKYNEKDTVNGLAICDFMLRDYDVVDEVAYMKLIDAIYSNIDIARMVINGASNGGYSFLLMSLWNHNLKLNEKQKSFAVNEAMNKIDTVRWQKDMEDFSKQLEAIDNGENDCFVDLDGSINIIDNKSGLQYINYMFSSLSEKQAHGIGVYDIRYAILKNPNWSLDEKKKLIMDFWYDDEDYAECLSQWKYGAINDCFRLNDDFLSLYEKFDFNQYTYDMLFDIFDNKEIVDRVWDEIEFCKQMSQLRPESCELESSKKKTLI